VGLFYNAPEPTRGGGLGKEQLFNNANALAYRGADISPLQPPYSEHTHTHARNRHMPQFSPYTGRARQASRRGGRNTRLI